MGGTPPELMLSTLHQELLVILDAVITKTIDNEDARTAAEAALGTFVCFTQIDDGTRITGIRHEDAVSFWLLPPPISVHSI